MTVFWKTDYVVTNTEIHFLPVDESHTHALSRDTKHLSLDGQVCFCRRLFSDDAKPRGCISWPVRPLRGINKTACMGCQTDSDGRLGLPGELCPAGSPTDGTALPFVSECLLWPAYGSPPAPTANPTPSHPPTPYRLNPRYYSRQEKTASKTRGVQIACGISYEILAI